MEFRIFVDGQWPDLTYFGQFLIPNHAIEIPPLCGLLITNMIFLNEMFLFESSVQCSSPPAVSTLHRTNSIDAFI